MNRRLALGSVAALLFAVAAPAHAEEGLTSPLTRFLPPPPEGWMRGPISVTPDENGMEPFVGAAYGPEQPGAKGGFGVTITHPSPHDMETEFPRSRPLGPNPMAPWMVTSREKVNELDAYLMWNEQGPGGVLQMRVGRVLVAVQGSDVTKAQILAAARSVDTVKLLKY
jgi:hypothetical protein